SAESIHFGDLLMTRKAKRLRAYGAGAAPAVPAATTPQAEVFSFGDPTPVLDRREILDYIECWQNGRWYEPPVSWEGLAKSFRASVHHSTAIYVKRNILTSTFVPHPK